MDELNPVHSVALNINQPDGCLNSLEHYHCIFDPIREHQPGALLLEDIGQHLTLEQLVLDDENAGANFG